MLYADIMTLLRLVCVSEVFSILRNRYNSLRKLNVNRGYTGGDPDLAKYACAEVRFHICDAMSIPA